MAIGQVSRTKSVLFYYDGRKHCNDGFSTRGLEACVLADLFADLTKESAFSYWVL